ncbi:MAG: hypothetical protein AB1540_12675, partial [Bdellovibrionota bacterium]
EARLSAHQRAQAELMGLLPVVTRLKMLQEKALKSTPEPRKEILKALNMAEAMPEAEQAKMFVEKLGPAARKLFPSEYIEAVMAAMNLIARWDVSRESAHNALQVFLTVHDTANYLLVREPRPHQSELLRSIIRQAYNTRTAGMSGTVRLDSTLARMLQQSWRPGSLEDAIQIAEARIEALSRTLVSLDQVLIEEMD